MSDERDRIVVFLGPSLPLREAREILDARYLPPARFGDVYGLIGGAVRTLVLIDGVFHGHAPVWPRELLCAMRSGIRVFGAASMGALRAAELHTLGMIGLGTVFRWYATGEIDGDDEAALLHTDPEQGYASLSMPLVNLRFNLREAVLRGILEPDEERALVAAMKALPFWRRSLSALRNTAAHAALGEARQGRLGAFLANHAIDLKRRDAAEALAEIARRPAEGAPAPEAPVALAPRAPAESVYYDRFRLLLRRIPGGSSEGVLGQSLVDRAFSDPARARWLWWALAAGFFMEEWARENRVGVPEGDLSALVASFRDRAGARSLTAFLRANALPEAEHGELLSRHLLRAWLLSRDAGSFGLDPALQDEALLPPSPDLGPFQPIGERAALARALPYVAAWCKVAGAAPRPKARGALTERWRGAFDLLRESGREALGEDLLQALWAVDRGPVHFGYTTWSPAAALIRELQITGAAASLAAGARAEATG